MRQKREQMWWLAACVVGLLVAVWSAGGFIGPLIAVFIVLFMAGAVLVEFEGRDRVLPDAVGEPPPEVAIDPEADTGPDAEVGPEPDRVVVEAAELTATDPEGAAGCSADVDVRDAASSPGPEPRGAVA